MFHGWNIKHFNWSLFGLVTILGIVGFFAIKSSITVQLGNNPNPTLHYKQLIWYGMGASAMLCCILIDYKILEQWAYPIYSGCIVLLILVLYYGKLVSGSRRWLVLGYISIQPSEIVKIGLIIIIARLYSKMISPRGLAVKDLILPGILTLIPFILIVVQPDLGTALLLLLIAGSMTIFVKLEKKTLFFILFLCGGMGYIIYHFFLKEYQKQRLLGFLNPDMDPLGAGYHIIQSKIAIGSGMLFGKGFLKGTQNSLLFLPEPHTDFIFSVLAEEWGFIGSAAILFVFLMLIICGFNSSHGSREPFGIILSVGLTSMIAWQVIVNIGMTMGLMPVVGVPLPFVSYGGSSMVSMMVCIGLLMNISMRRFNIE